MSWFKRLKDGISTATQAKKDVPEGLWFHCKECKETSTVKDLRENFFVCPKCDYHTVISSQDYFEIIFDKRSIKPLYDDLLSVDFLNFTDLKPYDKRLVEARNKTGLNDAIAVAEGKVNKLPLVIAAMDFKFIGGSMGSVVGEKISKAIDRSLETGAP
ncbi:MAG: acetyl-CoA carboxylase carboxyl transferase subunit beta, partial [Saprospiraceae bacterium]